MLNCKRLAKLLIATLCAGLIATSVVPILSRETKSPDLAKVEARSFFNIRMNYKNYEYLRGETATLTTTPVYYDGSEYTTLPAGVTYEWTLDKDYDGEITLEPSADGSSCKLKLANTIADYTFFEVTVSLYQNGSQVATSNPQSFQTIPSRYVKVIQDKNGNDIDPVASLSKYKASITVRPAVFKEYPKDDVDPTIVREEVPLTYSLIESKSKTGALTVTGPDENNYYHIERISCMFSSIEIIWHYKENSSSECSDEHDYSLADIDHEHVYTSPYVSRSATLSSEGSVIYSCIYCGKEKTEYISAANRISLNKSEYYYDGKAKAPTVKVIDREGTTLKENSAYKVSCGNANILPGTYKVTVKGIEPYDFTQTFSYKIKVKPTTMTKLTATSKGFKAVWAKQSSTNIKGYELQYSKNSNFSKAKTVTVSKASTSKKAISKLSKKTKYYVRIRTYISKSGKTYYSSWSRKQTVKTK